MTMRIAKGHMVPLGYGKYVRSDRIVGLEPIEDGRGPKHRTKVYVDQVGMPLTASRSDGAILRDLVAESTEVVKAQEQREALRDLLDALHILDPMLRSIIRDQGHLDVDRWEERLHDVLAGDENMERQR